MVWDTTQNDEIHLNVLSIYHCALFGDLTTDFLVIDSLGTDATPNTDPKGAQRTPSRDPPSHKLS